MRKKKQKPDGSPNFRVSQSKVKTWRRCRRAYHYKYVEELRAKKKSRALTFGGIVHQMIERDIEGDDPMEVLTEMDPSKLKLFAAEREEYGEIIDDARRIMTEYFAYWEDDENPLIYERIKGKSSEHGFEIEIAPGIIWNGKIDARGKREKMRWLVEHKTFKRKPGDDERWRNLQSASYFRAMDVLGWPSVDGTCWDYIWSKPPNMPMLLKDGTMSRKNIDTLPPAVVDAIKGFGLRDYDYRDFIKAAEAHRSKWFFRIYTPVNKEASDYLFNEFRDTAIEMAENHGKKSDMNIERHCGWCEFEPLCRAKLQGLDYDFIKERHYEKTESPDRDEAVHTGSLEE